MKCEGRHQEMPGFLVDGMLWSGAALMRQPDTERAKTNCFRHDITTRKQRLLRTSHARGIVFQNLARCHGIWKPSASQSSNGRDTSAICVWTKFGMITSIVLLPSVKRKVSPHGP